MEGKPVAIHQYIGKSRLQLSEILMATCKSFSSQRRIIKKVYFCLFITPIQFASGHTTGIRALAL